MARKLFIFLTGTLLLSAAWIGVVSSIETHQESLNSEGSPIKLDLMQSRWQRLAGFKAVEGEKLKKPARFVYNFSGPDMVLVDSLRSEKLPADLYLDVKTAAIDAGKDSSFYMFEAPSGEQFLLRSSRLGDELEITGFDLDSALNFFGQGLEDTEWFVLDSKKRVLAAGERAYVGKTQTAGSDYNSFKYALAGKSYEFLMLKQKEASLAAAHFMGVLGIIFIMAGLFFYTGNYIPEAEVVASPLMKSSHETYKKAFVPDAPSSALNLGLDSGIIEDDFPEDVKMVDLSTSEAPLSQNHNLDYTDFLIENPVLAKAPKVTGDALVEVPEYEKPVEVKVEAVTSDEWVKLAEELSANIDKFTETAEQSKSKSSSSKADA